MDICKNVTLHHLVPVGDLVQLNLKLCKLTSACTTYHLEPGSVYESYPPSRYVSMWPCIVISVSNLMQNLKLCIH